MKAQSAKRNVRVINNVKLVNGAFYVVRDRTRNIRLVAQYFINPRDTEGVWCVCGIEGEWNENEAEPIRCVRL